MLDVIYCIVGLSDTFRLAMCFIILYNDKMAGYVWARGFADSPNYYLSRVGSTFIHLGWDPRILATFRPNHIQVNATLVNHSGPARGQIMHDIYLQYKHTNTCRL